MKHTKEYLNRIRYINIEIDSLSEELETLKASFLGSQKLKHDKIQTSAKQSYDDNLVHYAELNDRINEKIDDLIKLKIKVDKEIDKLTDRKEAIVLRNRYIMNKSWKEIAHSLNYTERHIYKIHGKALLSFYDKVMKENCETVS